MEYNVNDYTIVCKEIGKGHSKPAIYEIKSEITGSLLKCLQLRHIYNPELRYFVLKKIDLEEVMEALKYKTLNSIPVSIQNKVVEL